MRRRNHYCQIVANILKYNIKHISLHKENSIDSLLRSLIYYAIM